MKEDKKVPQLRFPEFTDAWKQRKVKELCSISTGKSNTQDKVDDGEYPFYVRSPIVERSKKYLYDEEAVLTVGDGVGTGKVFHYVNGKYDLHQRCYRMFNFSEELNAKYFYHIFSKMFYKRVMSMTAKTSVDSVRMDMIADMEIPVPNIKEQEKIGAFFSDIDNLITLQQLKLNSLQKLKKGLLQKMFPKNGENIPEIRFPEFSDAWKQRKLEQIIDVGSGRDYKHLSEGGIPVYGTGGYMLSVNEALSWEEDAIGIGRKGTIDKPYILQAPFWTVDTLFYAIPKKEQDLDFLYCIFQNIDWKKKDESTGVPSLSKTIINKTYCMTPNYDEQKKIGCFFSKIDNLITLQQRKLNSLQKLQKRLLQKMFPKKGENITEIRFPEFSDAWKQRELGEIAERVTRRNSSLESQTPLTISAEYGLIDQNKFFGKRIAAKDLSNYYLIQKGEFAYNKSTSNDAPWGAIKRLDCYNNGALSTLYIVFKIKDNKSCYSDFLVTYYGTSLWHKGVKEIATEGARNHGLLNVSPSDFFRTKLVIPQDFEEQRKIGAFFTQLDNTITLQQRKLESLQKLKKGLLQQMFI